MKRLSVVLVCILAVLYVETGVSLAYVNQSIHVEWGYTPPSAPAVIGFKLYQEGVFIGGWSGANTAEGDITCVLVNEVTNFTLTAEFSDGTESPHSSPYALTISMRPSPIKDLMRIGGYEKIPLKPESLWAAVVPYGPEQKVLTVRVKTG